MNQTKVSHPSHAPLCGAKTRAGTPCQCPAIPRSETLPASWGFEPRRAQGQPEWQLHEWRLDSRGDRGAEMATFARLGFCAKGHRIMSKNPRRATTAVTAGNVPAPVRVRLKRINCDHARPYPPDGQSREWWQRLKNAFGTSSSAFVEASLHQLIAAARLPGGGISEIAVNASLALIEGAKPQDEIECALVIQMACTHTATMAVVGMLGGGGGTARRCAGLGLGRSPTCQDLHSAGRASSAATSWRAAIRARRACSRQRWRAGHHRKCAAGFAGRVRIAAKASHIGEIESGGPADHEPKNR